MSKYTSVDCVYMNSWKVQRCLVKGGKAVEIVGRKEARVVFCSQQEKTKFNKQLFSWQSSNYDSAVGQKKNHHTVKFKESVFTHKTFLSISLVWKKGKRLNVPRQKMTLCEWERLSGRPALTWLLCGLRYGLCALGRIRHLVRHGLGHTVLLAGAGILTRRVVRHLYLDTQSEPSGSRRRGRTFYNLPNITESSEKQRRQSLGMKCRKKNRFKCINRAKSLMWMNIDAWCRLHVRCQLLPCV